MESTQQVVITGLGVVSPIGLSQGEFWDSLTSGRGGVRAMPELAKLGLSTAFGGRVEQFEGKDFVTTRKSLKVMSHEIQWAYAAAKMACVQAGVKPGSVDPDRFGVVFGADMIYSEPADLIDVFRSSVVDGRFDFTRWADSARAGMSPLWLLKYLPNMPACHIGIAHDARGPTNSIIGGEVSSLVAMSEAVRLIERGAADVVITGGASDGLNMWSWAFRQTRHSRRAHDPAGACRPFDADRDGMVCGQGAAALVFESRRHAEARRAPALARVLSSAHAFDREPQATGTGSAVRRVVTRSLQQARLSPEQLGFIIACGYGTRESDRNEARGILAAAPHARVTALKGYMGCLHAASGALESAAAVMAFERGRVPATLNYRRPDPECPLNIVRDEPAPLAAPTAMILSESTMGQAAAVLLAGPEFG